MMRNGTRLRKNEKGYKSSWWQGLMVDSKTAEGMSAYYQGSSPGTRAPDFDELTVTLAELTNVNKYLQTNLAFTRYRSATQRQLHPLQSSAEQPHVDSGEDEERKHTADGGAAIPRLQCASVCQAKSELRSHDFHFKCLTPSLCELECIKTPRYFIHCFSHFNQTGLPLPLRCVPVLILS